MNYRRITATAVLAVVLVIGMVGCPKKPPAVPSAPSGPTSTWVGSTCTYRVWTTAGSSIRYIMDWGDNTADTTDAAVVSGDTDQMSHAWGAEGTFAVKVKAFLSDDSTKMSEFSDATSVTVGPNAAPVIDTIIAPDYTAIDAVTRFVLIAHDADGDSISFEIDWGDGEDSDSGFFASVCTVEMTHVYDRVDTVDIRAVARDKKGRRSIADTIRLVIGPAGAVITWWMNDKEDQASLSTSLVLASNGTTDCIYAACEDADVPCFYSIALDDFRRYKVDARQTTKFADNQFISHPVYVQATSHVITGSDEGELYALRADRLNIDWRYPGIEDELQLTNIEWGSPAVNGNKLYVGHNDDSLFLLIDNGVSVSRPGPAYAVHASVVDAPVIDASGNVIFATDSGYLVKLSADLATTYWRLRLQGNGEVRGPVIGLNGVIYCTSDSGRLYAINPDGSFTWTTQPGGYVTTMGEGSRPAVGTDGHVYLGAQYGRFYKFNGQTGDVMWAKYLGTGEFPVTPIIVTGGYLYAQNDDDMLFCVDQANGEVIWACDCPASLPRAARRSRNMQLYDYAPNPTITPEGNVIVVGGDAVYLVKGYTERTLDTGAPWPKWQRNLFNTGK